MVLKYTTQLLILFITITLMACSSNQRQKVVAVSSQGSGSMSETITKPRTIPTPKVVVDLLDMAEKEAEQENWAQATRLLDRAQRMASDEPRVYFSYGEIYFKQGMDAKAKAMFQRVLSLVDRNGGLGEQAQSYLRALGKF